MSKAKQLYVSEQNILQTVTLQGQTRLLKMTDLNVEGTKSFSSNYFCCGKFCQNTYSMMTNHTCCLCIIPVRHSAWSIILSGRSTCFVLLILYLWECVCVCLLWGRQKLVQPISLCLLAKVASANWKPTSHN